MAFYWLNSQLLWQSEQRIQHSVKYAYFSFFHSSRVLWVHLIIAYVKCLASERNSSQRTCCETSTCVYTQSFTQKREKKKFSVDCLKPFPHLGITGTQAAKRWWCARGILLSLVVVLSSVLSKPFYLLLSVPQQMLLFWILMWSLHASILSSFSSRLTVCHVHVNTACSLILTLANLLRIHAAHARKHSHTGLNFAWTEKLPFTSPFKIICLIFLG